MADIEKLTAKSLGDIPHGFLGRRGGVSKGIYHGLNTGLGSDDEAAAVAENRLNAAGAVLPGADLYTVFQIHSAQSVTVTAIMGKDRPKADAMVTRQPGILLGILTADCVPVLFADAQAGVVGAAHSGWKGALGGVCEAAIKAMERLGAKRGDITAAIGPCIAQKSYEVDDVFFGHFAAEDSANERFFSAGKSKGETYHYQFDIEGYVAVKLAAAGIAKVGCLGEDTYSQPDRFYSYRRACHKGEADYGRQISLIGLSA
ncbi:MAG: peptidoglycan editing factor PgeF [Sphingorhabdus sp.]